MGQSWVLPVRVPALLGGGMPGMVIAPQVMVKQDECLGLDIEGKSWQTTGPFVVEAEIYGVGITLESAKASPLKTLKHPPEAKKRAAGFPKSH